MRCRSFFGTSLIKLLVEGQWLEGAIAVAAVLLVVAVIMGSGFLAVKVADKLRKRRQGN